MNTILTSVISTGVRPSALGWPNGVEEPAVCLERQTDRAIRRLSFIAVLNTLLPCGSINLAQAPDSIFIVLTGERRCPALLDRTGLDARPHTIIP